MKVEVAKAIDELQRQFTRCRLSNREDGQGGAYVILENISLGTRYKPESTWIGFHLPAQYPYADIYPVFVGSETARVDGRPFTPPVTPGHHFEGRTALQISRRSGAAQNGLQKATAKILKVLDFLEKL